MLWARQNSDSELVLNSHIFQIGLIGTAIAHSLTGFSSQILLKRLQKELTDLLRFNRLMRLINR